MDGDERKLTARAIHRCIERLRTFANHLALGQELSAREVSDALFASSAVDDLVRAYLERLGDDMLAECGLKRSKQSDEKEQFMPVAPTADGD